MMMIKMMMMIMLMIIVGVSSGEHKPKLITVGGDHGWGRIDFSYKLWGMEQHLYTGDTLYFGYNRTLYSVLVVNQTNFKACISDHPVQNITGGAGKDIFKLTSEQTYYFISGGGYCNSGVKFDVNVVDYDGENGPGGQYQGTIEATPKLKPPSKWKRVGTGNIVLGGFIVFCIVGSIVGVYFLRGVT